MATRIDENSQRASRPIGRNLNPLVSNVFPSAFAKKFKKQRDNQLQDVAELFRSRGTGIRTRASRLGRALYHVVLRAFPPLQKESATNNSETISIHVRDLRQARLVATG